MKHFRGISSGWIAALFLAIWSGTEAAAAEQMSALRCPLPAGHSSFTISIDGRDRRVEIAVGTKAGAKGPAPVVFLWHGWGGDPRGLLASLGLDEVWPEAVAIAPRGLPRRIPRVGATSQPGWQVEPGEFGDRDLQLFDALVRKLSKLECLDPSRFVSSGFSNGAYFSNLLGCERPSVLAAIAPVGGGGPPSPCQAPIAVWVAHGDRDRVVPVREARSTFSTWRAQNACDASETSRGEGCIEAGGCLQETILCTFRGGHTWPRGLTPRWLRFLRRQSQFVPNDP